MAEPQPLQTIPQHHADNGVCSACDHTPLAILRLPDAADQLTCTRCGLTYELERAGDRIRVRQLPNALVSLYTFIGDTWILPSDITTLRQRQTNAARSMPPPPELTPPPIPRSPAAKPSTTPAASDPTPPPDETPAAVTRRAALLEKAEALRKLDKPPKTIFAILKAQGAHPADLRLVMREIVRRNQAAARNQRRTVAAFGVIASIFVLTMVGLAVLVTVRPDLLRPTPTPPAIASTGNPLYDLLRELLPPGVASMIEVEAPRVDAGIGPGDAICPRSPQDAANLYGGAPMNWSYSPEGINGGWLLINLGNPIDVTIPANMSAGLLVSGDDTLTIRPVDGPATLRNVNFVVISCAEAR